VVRQRFSALLLLALLLRLGLALALVGNYDQESYAIVPGIMRQGGNVYAETIRYNYSPVWFTLVAAFDKAAKALTLPLHVVLRSFLSVVDIANALLIGAIVEQYQRGWGRKTALFYALNPGSILLVGYHGQFELLAMVPFLAGVYLVIRYGGVGHKA
jgi:hypothetical protein